MQPGGMGGASSATPWGAIASTVGQVGGALLQAGAARKQNRILADATRGQNRAGMEASGVVGNTIGQMRGLRTDPATEQGYFADALGGPRVQVPMTASRAAQGHAAGATAQARNYGGDLAALFARIRAPQHLQRSQNEALLQMGNAMRPIQTRAQDDQYVANLRAGMVQPNPWAMLGFNALQRAGDYATSQRK